MVDCLFKKRHYAPYVATDKKTSAKATTDIFMRYIFHCNRLLKSIILDQDPQFISSTLKALCQRSKIDVKLSTAFHPETDSQIRQVNQDVQHHYWSYCSYM